MFRPSDCQTTFGSLNVLLSPEKQAYLDAKHWAGAFRRKALPLLLECELLFATLFCSDNGRPNKPVAQVVGLLLLKEMFDLTDAQAIDQYMFNTAWQYALGVEPDAAHICQKTLHNFRVAMSEAEADGDLTYSVLFDRIVRAVIDDLGLSVSKQRLDSTHIRSNMAVLSRLQLFTHTITAFLEKLRKQHRRLFAALPEALTARYVDRAGYFADAPSSEGRRRLDQCAADLWRLVDRFRGHRKVSGMASYQRLARLLDDQCVVEDTPATDPDGDGPDGVPVRVKEPKVERIEPTSLQGSDDDATYGHKGKGYQAQVAETCDEGNVTEVVTYVSVEGAHKSDQHAVIPVVEALEANDCKPEEIVADTNYGRGQNIVDAAEHDVALTSPACGAAPQPAEGEVTRDDFEFSADGQELKSCPKGHVPIEQGPSGSDGTRRTARMDAKQCADCPLMKVCPTRFNPRAETMTFTWSPAEGATAARRRTEKTPAFKTRYRIRSGIEATNSEYKRAYGGGRLRVRGHPAVARTVKFKFMALNLRRWMRAARKTTRKAA
ncbi:MAG: transposase [Phycisphaerae bacterium]